MKRWLFLLCIFVSYAHLKGQVVFSDSSQRILAGKGLELYIGKEQASFAEVSASQEFVSLDNEVPNIGIFQSDKWLRLMITNQSQDTSLLLEIAYPLLDEVEVFLPNENSKYTSILYGEYQDLQNRKYKSPNYIFDLHIPKDSTQIIFLRVNSTEQIILPVYISNRLSSTINNNKDLFSNGIYIGIVLIMAIYNLFLFFSVKEKGYLYYVLYIVFAGITQISIKGYSLKYLWPEWPGFPGTGPIIFSCLSGLGALLFTDSFLRLQKNAPRLRLVFGLFIIFFVLSLLMITINQKQEAFLLMQLNTGAASIFVLYVSYRVMIEGYSPAKFFVFGWTILLIGSLIFILKDYGILQYNYFTSNAVQIASVIEMALLSFGLAYSINILKKENEISQERELAVSLENERLIREQNIVLEQKVEERTHELKESNESLQKTLLHLKEAQSQLVESEKMASLGQLTAGVAHEINNPINFVTSSVTPLKRDIQMVWEALQEMERIALADNIPSDQKRIQVEAYKEDLDIDYLKDEVDFLLQGMYDGANRTAEIVKSLRIFSRVDEDTLVVTDLHEGLESTLIILRSSMKDKIQVEKHYYSSLPLVECHAGKINQVFLNILTNAIYAIDKKFEHTGGKLVIETGIAEDPAYVSISIRDNGIGIPEEIRERIFDPFFTTKAVGEGTGLGMSITYKTIDKHQGRISIDSVEGEYTVFTLFLPIKQSMPDSGL